MQVKIVQSVTQRQIAQRLGVSQRTVSVAFSGSGRVGAETRRKIIETAAAMGYRPNAAAVAMRNGRFGAIGMLSSSRVSEAVVHPSTLWAVQEELSSRNMLLTMSVMPDRRLTDEQFLPSVLRQWSVDGLLVSYTYNAPAELVPMLQRHQTPAIWVNCRLADDCVHPDDYLAGRMAAEALLTRGHKHLGYIGFRPAESHYSASDRKQGFDDAVRAGGARGVHMSLGGAEPGTTAVLSAVTAWLALADRPTGIVTYGEDEAGLVLLAARTLGLAMPGDLSLMCVRNGSALMCGVAVSGMETRHGPVGHLAVEQLLKKIQAPSQKLEPVVVAPRPLDGQTLGPPPER
jgi:LacI family transcriptional regulator